MQQKKTRKNLLSRWFKPRDLMIRERDKITYCSLSAKRQEVLFLILCALTVWSVFTTFYFLRYESVFAQKSDELSRLQAEYADLQDKVFVFADHFNKIIAEEENEQLIPEDAENIAEQPKIKKIDSSVQKRETAKQNEQDEQIKQISRLQNETALLRERLLEMVDASNVSSAENKRLSFHKVLLQRDMAAAETQALQEKVKSLEKLISGMQEAQILTFRKMASLADDSIDVLENGLSDIKQSLIKTGVGMETLLHRIRRDRETVGIGGPFIPTPMPKPQHDLNISLVRLNQRLDRWYDLSTLQSSLPLGKPVDRLRITSAFGSRGDPFQGGPASHEAVDLGGMIGEPIYATAPGKVVRTGSWGWYGNMVEIDHGLGFRTRYAHMEKIFVTKGETVRAGDRIGTLGNTGRSTGPHLHYEIRIRGVAVDPMKFIKVKKNVFKS